MLISVEEAAAKIKKNDPLVFAGDESALSKLPRGNWIGGTIPYFNDEKGGQFNDSQVFMTEWPAEYRNFTIRFYKEKELPQIPRDAYENGFSVLIIPAGSDAHLTYAKDAPSYDGIFTRPIVGWIAGTAVEEIGKKKAKVFDGRSGAATQNEAACIHFSIPDGYVAQIGIHNIFKRGTSDLLQFKEDGFSVKTCLVNGKEMNFAEYVTKNKIDTRLPLVADYSGIMVNVSFQNIDERAGVVTFYAPVFAGVEYRLASPVLDYQKEFEKVISAGNQVKPVYSCNCILNYLYGELEGKKISSFYGPMTFGEIAYQLLNQTLVYVEVLKT